MGKAALILLVAATGVASGDVDPGRQATTLRTAELPDPQPQQVLTAERMAMVMKGVAIAVDVASYSPQGGVAVRLARAVNEGVTFSLDVADGAIDARTRLLEADLLLLDADASRLEVLCDAGACTGDEAQTITQRMVQRCRADDGHYTFMRRALFSEQGLYVTVTAALTYKLHDLAGQRLARALGLRGAVKRGLKGRLPRAWMRGEAWKGLKERADDETKVYAQIADKLASAVLDDTLKTPLDEEIRKEIARRGSQSLQKNPSHVSGGGGGRPADLRLDAGANPLAFIALAARPLLPAPPAARALEPWPKAVVGTPVNLIVPSDPVVRYLVVENVVSAVSNHVDDPPAPDPEPETYDVEPSHGTTRSPPSMSDFSDRSFDGDWRRIR